MTSQKVQYMSNTDRKAMTFRLTRLARERLAELATENNISATRVVEDLILDRCWFRGQIPDKRAGLVEGSDGKVKIVDKTQAASVTVPGDKSEGRKNTPPAAKVPTRAEREAMTDAFYRDNMGKGKK